MDTGHARKKPIVMVHGDVSQARELATRRLAPESNIPAIQKMRTTLTAADFASKATVRALCTKHAERIPMGVRDTPAEVFKWPSAIDSAHKRARE